MTNLFSPTKVGDIDLEHRVVMAPMTRMRANVPSCTANELMSSYYSQRATKGGLLITEGSHISPQGQPMHASPGIHSLAQTEAWKQVVDGVHKKQGKIFLQLWHVGRVSHSSFQSGNLMPVAPSPVAVNGEVITKSGQRVPYEVPQELSLSMIQQLIEDYRLAAKNAHLAGFDGVEIHSANGWLLEQFLQKRSNLRSDIYGGSVENRCRLVLQVVDAVCSIYSSSRVGIRLSPFGRINDSGEDDPMLLYTYLVQQLNLKKLSYLHLVEPRSSGAAYKDVDHQDVPSVGKLFRPLWQGSLIVAGNFNKDTATQVVETQQADAVAFGRWFISNPDLVDRLKTNKQLSPYDRKTFYQGGKLGYIDYTTIQKVE